MKFDRKLAFDGLRRHLFAGGLTQDQTDSLTFLFDHFEAAPIWADYRHIAYALATIYTETNKSMAPVEEGYYLEDRFGIERVHRFQHTLRYYPYFGRGYVQLTWNSGRIHNYQKATDKLREECPDVVKAFEARTGQTFDLVKHPEQALDPEIAFWVLTFGMFEGWFTGRKLEDFINDDECNYYEARTIINGHNVASMIASNARLFQQVLHDALIKDAVAVSVPVEGTQVAQAAQDAAQGNDTPTSIVSDGQSTGDPQASGSNLADLPTAAQAQKLDDAVPVQTVSAAPSVENKLDDQLNKWSARYAAIPAAAITFFGGAVTWLKDSPVHLTVTLFVIFGSIIGLYVLGKQVSEALKHRSEHKLASEREQRQFELQRLMIESAASKDKNTVVLVPPPVEVPNTDTVA